MDSAGPNNLSFKYQVFTPSGLQDIGIINLSLWQRLNSFVWASINIKFVLDQLYQ